VSEVIVNFALKIGSELVREEDLPEPSELDVLASEDGIYGALVVEIDGEEIVRETHWDRIDAVLEHLIEAIDEAEEGNEGVAEFPDTRLELVIREGEEEAEVEFDDTVVQVNLDDLRGAVLDCIERLVELAEERGERLSSHLRRLRAMVRDD
jgi:hypothetical protein